MTDRKTSGALINLAAGVLLTIDIPSHNQYRRFEEANG